MAFFLEKSNVSKRFIPVKVKKGTLDTIGYAKERNTTRIYLKETKVINFNDNSFGDFSREKFEDAEEWSRWILTIYDLDFPSEEDEGFGRFIARAFRELKEKSALDNQGELND